MTHFVLFIYFLMAEDTDRPFVGVMVRNGRNETNGEVFYALLFLNGNFTLVLWTLFFS